MSIVFFVSEEGITVVDSQLLTLESGEACFLWDEKEEFAKLLTTIPYDVFSAVVLDFVDEHIEHKLLPKLMPWERGQQEVRLMQKTKSFLANVEWLKSQKNPKNGRAEQEVRMVSLPKTGEIEYFFSAIYKAKLTTAVIYSHTFLIGQLFFQKVKKQLSLNSKKSNSSVLLVIKEGKHVFRQIFITERDIKFTRLINIDLEIENPVDIAYSLLREAQLLVKHIYNHKILPYNHPIDLVNLGDDEVLGEKFLDLYKEKVVLDDWFKKGVVLENINFEKISIPNEAYSKITFREVIANYILESSPKTFYKNTYTKRIQKIIQAKKTLYLSSVLIFGIGLLITGKFWVDRLVMQESNVSLQHSLVFLSKEKKILQENLELEYDAEDIREIVLFSKKVLEEKSRQSQLFNVRFLEESLTRHANIQITDLEWGSKETFDFRNLKVTLSGWVFPFEGAYAQPLKWTDLFVEDIKLLPNVINVKLVEEPINRQLTVSISVSDQDGTIEALPFKIEFEVGVEKEEVLDVTR